MFSDDLRQLLEGVKDDFPSINLADSGVFRRQLVFIWHVIRASEPLLEWAIQHSDDGALTDYFVEHLAEEHDHEKWLADDLATVGIDVATTDTPYQAAAMAGSQYYFIKHRHPRALLGYMAFLEFFPMPLSVVEQVEAVHGEALCRTLRYHAVHDVDHGSDLCAVLDSLPEADRLLVVQSALQTATYYGSAIANFQ